MRVGRRKNTRKAAGQWQDRAGALPNFSSQRLLDGGARRDRDTLPIRRQRRNTLVHLERLSRDAESWRMITGPCGPARLYPMSPLPTYLAHRFPPPGAAHRRVAVTTMTPTIAPRHLAIASGTPASRPGTTSCPSSSAIAVITRPIATRRGRVYAMLKSAPRTQNAAKRSSCGGPRLGRSETGPSVQNATSPRNSQAPSAAANCRTRSMRGRLSMFLGRRITTRCGRRSRRLSRPDAPSAGAPHSPRPINILDNRGF